LNETERAFFELRDAIAENFADNGFSMYRDLDTPFQIDANYGLGGAVLSMLVVDMPSAFGTDVTRTVVLGPARPTSRAGGKVEGLRIRGGGSVDFEWDAQGFLTRAQIRDRSAPAYLVDRNGELLAKL
jgi:alpha-L-fucosidase 2